MKTVIYHAACTDGFVAAHVAREHGYRDATFVAANYGDPAPDIEGHDVLIVDFSYPREVLIGMNTRAAKLRVFDHHKTAKEACEGLPFCVFDMNRSGAGITWDELAKGKRPWLVDYVEDRDLWRWALPNSREINAYLQHVPQNFDILGNIEFCGKTRAAEHGRTAMMVVQDYVARMLPLAETRKWGVFVAQLLLTRNKTDTQVNLMSWAQYAVPVINAGPWATSELLEVLAKDQPFAAAWLLTPDGHIVCSLRSEPGKGVDVSEIAKGLGGGGHKHAAGFKL